MKTQLAKLLFCLLLISATVLNSCTNMKNQTEEIININRELMNNDIKALQQQKIISETEAKQIQEQLNADLDHYLQHQNIDLPGLEKMFLETVKSFENIKINQAIFSVIIRAYGNITGQITMRNSPIKQEDYAVQSQLNKVMNNWFDDYQNESEKITDLITQINNQKQAKIYPDISSAEYDEMISTITRIKNDTTLSSDEIKKILTAGMLKYCNKSNDANLAILNIYNGMDRIKKLGIHEELMAIYQNKHSQAKVPTYAEMKQQVSERLKILLTEEMIDQLQYELLITKINKDIGFCESNANKELVKPQLLSSLKKLKAMELDTEDREAVAEWYFLLAQKSKINISKELNVWLYDFDPK